MWSIHVSLISLTKPTEVASILSFLLITVFIPTKNKNRSILNCALFYPIISIPTKLMTKQKQYIKKINKTRYKTTNYAVCLGTHVNHLQNLQLLNVKETLNETIFWKIKQSKY